MAMSVEYRPKLRAFQRVMVRSPYHLIEKISIWDEKNQQTKKKQTFIPLMSMHTVFFCSINQVWEPQNETLFVVAMLKYFC